MVAANPPPSDQNLYRTCFRGRIERLSVAVFSDVLLAATKDSGAGRGSKREDLPGLRCCVC